MIGYIGKHENAAQRSSRPLRSHGGVIEFVGPSGAGKSSVARAVLGLPGAPTWGRRSLAPDSRRARVVTLVRTLPALAFVPTVAWRLGSDREARRACRHLGRPATVSLIGNAARNRWQSLSRQTHLHDQGLVQSLAHRTRHWPEGERVEAVAAVWSALGAGSAPSLIVRFDVDPEVGASRSKLDGRVHHDPAEVTTTDVAIEQSVLAAGRALDVPTIRTRNSADVAVTAADLLARISRAGAQGPVTGRPSQRTTVTDAA